MSDKVTLCPECDRPATESLVDNEFRYGTVKLTVRLTLMTCPVHGSFFDERAWPIREQAVQDYLQGVVRVTPEVELLAHLAMSQWSLTSDRIGEVSIVCEKAEYRPSLWIFNPGGRTSFYPSFPEARGKLEVSRFQRPDGKYQFILYGLPADIEKYKEFARKSLTNQE